MLYVTFYVLSCFCVCQPDTVKWKPQERDLIDVRGDHLLRREQYAHWSTTGC